MTQDKLTQDKLTQDKVRGSATFSAAEKAAMRAKVQEERKAARKGLSQEDKEGLDLQEVVEKIAGMAEDDRAMAERIHEIVTKAAPQLKARLWYGMPAYTQEGKLVCFFKDAAKFKQRYATFGMEEAAQLDEGSMWATSWALTKLTKADEKRIADLVRKAVG
jgi:uncharacterized protein YdhG (YjbR/CyaY superfamily)